MTGTYITILYMLLYYICYYMLDIFVHTNCQRI